MPNTPKEGARMRVKARLEKFASNFARKSRQSATQLAKLMPKGDEKESSMNKMPTPERNKEGKDVLCKEEIIPEKTTEPEVSKKTLATMNGKNIEEKQAVKDIFLNPQQREDYEDEEDEWMLLEYRNKRVAEMRMPKEKSTYGSVMEITEPEYLKEVGEASEDGWVLLHLYKPSIDLCNLLNEHLDDLAIRFPATKFTRSNMTTSIPYYADESLPTILVFHERIMKEYLAPSSFTFTDKKPKVEELEYMLGWTGCVPREIKNNPWIMAKLGRNRDNDSDSD